MQAKRTLGVYVDESGNFGDTADLSRYCMVTLVFHDDDADCSSFIREYENSVFNLGADPESMSFHTAPLIRQEDQFSAMSRNMRGKIFYQMLSLVRKCDIRYASFCVDTAFVTSEEQVVSDLKSQIRDFMQVHRADFSPLTSVLLHYDAGQKGVTRVLEAIPDNCPCHVETVQGVRQSGCLMLQVADFLCTISLIERRIADGVPFNHSEKRFFGSPRDFKRNVVRKIKSKEI